MYHIQDWQGMPELSAATVLWHALFFLHKYQYPLIVEKLNYLQYYYKLC
jgi:hypothetical protein